MVRDGVKYSLMIRAILLNDYHTVRSLLLAGYPINQIDDCGRTPLHIAARHGSDRVVDALIERGADINLKDANGHRAVDISLKNGHVKTWRSINLSHAKMVRHQPIHRHFPVEKRIYSNIYSDYQQSALAYSYL